MANDRDKFELPAFVVTEAKKFLEDEGEPMLRPPKNSDERVLWIGWSFASEEQCLLDPKSLKIAPHRTDYWDDGSGFTEESTTLAAESAASFLSNLPIENFFSEGTHVGSITTGFIGGDGPDDWVSEIKASSAEVFSYLQFALDAANLKIRIEKAKAPEELDAYRAIIRKHADRAQFSVPSGRWSGLARQGLEKDITTYIRKYLAAEHQLPSGEHTVNGHMVKFTEE